MFFPTALKLDKFAHAVSNYIALLRNISTIVSYYFFEALLIFIKIVHISSLKRLPLHKIILFIKN